MSNEKKQGISFFEKYLTIWVLLCMAVGILIGKFLPGVRSILESMQIGGQNIPLAILMWIMIYPMMLKVDFGSIVDVSKKPKGLIITSVTNWLIKPFTMYAIAAFFFYVVFRSWIPLDLAKEYVAGAVILGAAPCTAMVFVWSHLTKGDAAYTLVQVAVNDLIILILFAPIVALLLGIDNVVVPMATLLLSTVLFVVVPLLLGVITRNLIIKNKGLDYFQT